MGQTRDQVSVSYAGASALLLQSISSRFDDEFQKRVWHLARSLKTIEGFAETVPGMNNLLASFDPAILDPRAARELLLNAWSDAPANSVDGKLVEIGVVYGGKDGEDFLTWARHCGLWPTEAAHRHASAIYQVAAVGAMPGFPYLSGLHPSLAIPRRSTPRMEVREGSVIVGGAQASIMPQTSPSGWHIIGKADIKLFDPHRDQPATLAAGDLVQFRIVDIRHA